MDAFCSVLASTLPQDAQRGSLLGYCKVRFFPHYVTVVCRIVFVFRPRATVYIVQCRSGGFPQSWLIFLLAWCMKLLSCIEVRIPTLRTGTSDSVKHLFEKFPSPDSPEEMSAFPRNFALGFGAA